MAAAGQPRADFPGDDLRRTARKSEEADRTRPLLALPAILDGVRFRAGGAAALVTRGEPGRERLAVHRGHLAFDPRFHDLRPHRRSLLPGLEHPQASARARPLNRRARRGPSGGGAVRGEQ